MQLRRDEGKKGGLKIGFHHLVSTSFGGPLADGQFATCPILVLVFYGFGFGVLFLVVPSRLGQLHLQQTLGRQVKTRRADGKKERHADTWRTGRQIGRSLIVWLLICPLCLTICLFASSLLVLSLFTREFIYFSCLSYPFFVLSLDLLLNKYVLLLFIK